ncbi:MAG: flagellar basal body rod protein FlgF [Legionellales bacterium]
MTDSVLYTSSNGAKNLLSTMQLIANNLSNVNTTAFHADYGNLTAAKPSDGESPSRIHIGSNGVFTDPTPGPINYTGRELDIAIKGQGYISVQTKQGQQAFTRAGNLNITPQGLLVTGKGDLVLGPGGAIEIPATARVSIDAKGVVSAHIPGQPAKSIAEVGRIGLVEALPGTMQKGEDGLFYPRGDATPVLSTKISLERESLEGSNVDVVRSLTDLIECSRQFDMHTKQFHTADENASKSNQLLNVQS